MLWSNYGGQNIYCYFSSPARLIGRQGSCVKPSVPGTHRASRVTGEQVVLADDLHDRMQAPMVNAVALHHLGPSPEVKHANGCHVGPRLVEAQRLLVRPANVSVAESAVVCTMRNSEATPMGK